MDWSENLIKLWPVVAVIVIACVVIVAKIAIPLMTTERIPNRYCKGCGKAMRIDRKWSPCEYDKSTGAVTRFEKELECEMRIFWDSHRYCCELSSIYASPDEVQSKLMVDKKG